VLCSRRRSAAGGLGDLRRADLLYCGIHLRQYFQTIFEATQTVKALLADVWDRYRVDYPDKDAISFHCADPAFSSVA